MPVPAARLGRLRSAPPHRRFAADARGLAATEFALILPIMVAFYFGMVALTMGIMQDRKVTLVSRTVADLAGRAQGTMNNAEIDNIVGAAGSVLAPYDPNGIEIIVASVAVRRTGQDAQGRETVSSTICWSAGRTITKVGEDYVTRPMSNLREWTQGRPYPGTLPSGFATGNTSFVTTTVSQEYTPIIGENLMKMVISGSDGSITLSERTPWPIRNVREIPWEGQVGCLPAA